MIFSIFAYIIAGIFMWLLGKIACLSTNHCQSPQSIGTKNFYSIPILLSLIFFSLFFGLRSYNTGVDTIMYVKFYDYYSSWGSHIRENIEPAYKWLTEIYGSLHLPTWFFLATFGFLQIFFVYYALRNYRCLLPYVGAYIILGPIFLDWANGMRQCLVSCVFLFSIEFIQNKKLISYLIIIFLCSLMHKSALILLPFYWLLKYKLYPPNSLVRICIVMLCVIIGQTPTWFTSLQSAADLLAILGYVDYAENFEGMLEVRREMAFGPSRISLLLVSLWIIWLVPHIIRTYNLPKQFESYFSLYFIGSCGYNLFTYTLNIFLRPIGYFTITSVVLAPLTLYHLIQRKQTFKAILLGILMYWYSTYVSLKAYIGGGNGDVDHAVYSFFFFN